MASVGGGASAKSWAVEAAVGRHGDVSLILMMDIYRSALRLGEHATQLELD